MLDWPGKVAATVFLSGCDFRCPFCHNPGLVGRHEDPTQWEGLRDYLRLRRNWIDGVVITGGEPTDDPALATLLDELASEELPVKLDTNGSHPELLGRLIAEQLIDYIAVDVKTTYDRYAEATGREDAAARVRDTVRTVIESGVAHEFRTTAYPELAGPDEIVEISLGLTGARLYALQQFRPQRTLDPRAGRVKALDPEALHAVAERCRAHVPTIVRGA